MPRRYPGSPPLTSRRSSTDARGILLERNQASLAEPFLPPSARFDTIDPKDRLGPYLLASAIEAREQLRAFSSYFVAEEPKTLQSLEAMVKLGFADEPTERRLSLVRRAQRR